MSLSSVFYVSATATRNPRPDQSKVAIETSQGFGKVSDIGIGIRHSIEGPGPAPTAKASGKTDYAPVLKATASPVPGQGFGGSLDSPQPTSSTSRPTQTYDRVLHQRHQILLIHERGAHQPRQAD